MYEQIHTPRSPAPVPLALGEQNRSETIDLGRINGASRGGGSARIIIHNLEFKDIPRTAWCDQIYNGQPELRLECTWRTNTEPQYVTAIVGVPLPQVEDLSTWRFDRETLQAVPDMKYWFTVNSGYVLGMFIFGILTLIFCTFILPEYEKKQELLA
ncbi:MAG: hypothetical protein KBB78_02785 [Candidatus Pacebacteria bacterium]|nr:hypothetical protein [Candidatus Paceibacterota bacterium]